MTTETLHARFPLGWSDHVWVEQHVNWEFTKRIKYSKYHGKFNEMYLEITWKTQERIWYSFWKQTTITHNLWVKSKDFEYMPPHKETIEETIVECE